MIKVGSKTKDPLVYRPTVIRGFSTFLHQIDQVRRTPSLNSLTVYSSETLISSDLDLLRIDIVKSDFLFEGNSVFPFFWQKTHKEKNVLNDKMVY